MYSCLAGHMDLEDAPAAVSTVNVTVCKHCAACVACAHCNTWNIILVRPAAAQAGVEEG